MSKKAKGHKKTARMIRGALSFALVLAVAISLVSMVDGLEQSRALRLDLSFNGITSQSAVSNRVLDALDQDVHAYAIFSKGQEDRNLIGLLERLAARSIHFTYSLENLAANPNLARSISSSLRDGDISADCLVIQSKATNRLRILTAADFLEQGFDLDSQTIHVSGFRYEKSLMEAIVFVSSQRIPQIQILTGHGELSDTQTASMEALLAQYNYASRRVHLLSGEELQPSDPLLILSPQKDLTADETQLLDQFARKGGSVLITDDFTSAPALPNYEAFLRTFGIVRRPGLVVSLSPSSAYPDMPAVLLPKMLSTEPTASLVASRQTARVLAGSTPFSSVESAGSELIVQPVLQSGPAYVRNSTNMDERLDQQPGDETGDFILAMLADRAFEDGTHARAFVIGNSGLFTDSWMHANTYSSELFLNVINYLDPGEPIDLPIRPKDAMRAPFTLPNNWLSILLIAIPPMAALALGMLILLPRRRR